LLRFRSLVLAAGMLAAGMVLQAEASERFLDGARFAHASSGFWINLRDSALLAALAFVLQTSFIVYLLIERRKRMRAEHSLEVVEQQSAAAIDRLHLVEHRYNSILDDIGEQLVSLQEEERRRIAQELHDSTAQHLVAIELLMMRMRTLVQQRVGADTVLDQMKSSLKQAQRELRIFTYLLHPPDLRSEGLKTTMERFIDGFADRTGIVARTSISNGIDALPYVMQRSVLRIVQEALANVHRHAQADVVTVKLVLRQERVDLRIADNGRGIAEGSRSLPHHGVGIPGMRARARHFGGDVKIFSGRRGTLVAAMIPCEPTPSAGTPAQDMHDIAIDLPPPRRAAS
jgi:signal transduction histidine kinase